MFPPMSDCWIWSTDCQALLAACVWLCLAKVICAIPGLALLYVGTHTAASDYSPVLAV